MGWEERKKKIKFIKQTVSEVYYLTDGTISKTNEQIPN